MRILLADDDATSLRTLTRAVGTFGYEPVLAPDGDRALEILHSPEPPEMAILDWMMPRRDGPDVIRALRARAAEPYTYTLLLTSRAHKADLIAGLDAGADDYLAKPFDLQELEVRLRTGRRIVELQRSLIETREALRAQASRDPLTGLFNRRAMMERLDHYFQLCVREGKDLGVLMIDLDRFKSVNDTHGHAVGDVVLTEAAARISAALRQYDLVGRVGGEEFVAVLPGADPVALVSVAERVCRAVSEVVVRVTDVLELPVTASIGCASLSRCGNPSPFQLLREADLALYASKANGRNQVSPAWRIPPSETGALSLN